jgi:hypothetical protein
MLRHACLAACQGALHRSLAGSAAHRHWSPARNCLIRARITTEAVKSRCSKCRPPTRPSRGVRIGAPPINFRNVSTGGTGPLAPTYSGSPCPSIRSPNVGARQLSGVGPFLMPSCSPSQGEPPTAHLGHSFRGRLSLTSSTIRKPNPPEQVLVVTSVIGIARGAGSRGGGRQRSPGNPLTAGARRDYFSVFLGKTADVGVREDLEQRFRRTTA